MLLQIEEFLESGHNSMWLSIDEMEIFVRKSVRQNPNKHGLIRCFDIANVNSSDKGVGHFTRFLDSLNELRDYGFQFIYVEQVLNPRFAEFFRKRKAQEVTDLTGTPSFFIQLEN